MSKEKRKLLMEICSNRLGITAIRPELDNQINLLLKESNFKYIKECADRISESLASTGSSMVKARVAAKARELNKKIISAPHVLSYDKYESVAYAASRMTPNYAAIYNVLAQLKKRNPDFNPASLMDFGTGTGAGLFAASHIWKDIHKVLGIDLSESMLKIVERFSTLEPALAIRNLKLQRYLAMVDKPKEENLHDLVISAFTLTELPNDNNRRLTVRALWRQTNDTLVLIDRGNPLGFNAISAARTQLINLCNEEKEEFHIVAPRRLLDKAPRESHKDIKYCYLVIRKKPRPVFEIDAAKLANKETVGESVKEPKPDVGQGFSGGDFSNLIQPSYQWDRIVMPLIKGKKNITLDLCTKEGRILRSTISKSKAADQSYSLLRKLNWGDLWPFKLKNSAVPAWNTKIEELRALETKKKAAKGEIRPSTRNEGDKTLQKKIP
ncbi:hypothetical protein HDV01_002924 [Terramyces sp. JEL0728]|nr:hypothetical protein HDV01_002924 [Terramyces sp. JEL0728]